LILRLKNATIKLGWKPGNNPPNLTFSLLVLFVHGSRSDFRWEESPDSRKQGVYRKVEIPPADSAGEETVRATVTNRGNARVKRAILPAAIFERFVIRMLSREPKSRALD